MLQKEIKLPMIIGIILYGAALLIDLIGVLIPDIAYALMGTSFLKGSFDGFIFPLYTLFQIIGMIMLIVFYLAMLKYKGNDKRVVGIVLIVIYCVISVVLPYFEISESQFYALSYGENGLAAFGTLRSYITLFTRPFTTVSTVFVFIAIGRYGISKTQQNNDTFYNGWTTEIKEGQENDESIH